MTTSIEQAVATNACKVYVKGSSDAIWDAITNPDQAQRYGYRSGVEYELRPGGVYRAFANEGMLAMGAPDVIIEGEVVEADPSRRLVQTWNPLFDSAITSEVVTRLTWEILADGRVDMGGQS